MMFKSYLLFIVLSLMLYGKKNDGSMERLIFIYNAEGGKINATIDYFHKLVSPNTYDCNLCKLTYDNFGEIKEWERFIRSLSYSVKFKYKDDIDILGLSNEIDFPVLISGKNNVLLSATEINSFTSLEELMNAISNILNE